MSVKPRGARPGGLLPVTDVGVRPFAAGLAVGTEAEDVDFTFDTRVEVLVRTTPWIVGQLFEVGTPIRRNRSRVGLADQRAQALFGRWVALIVQPIQLESLHQIV